MGQLALITGTSSGIGLATSVVLAKAGFRVVATMRNLGKATALRERAERENIPLDLRQLDVVDPASVEACVSGVLSDYGHIDVLVNNAGAGYRGALETTPIAAAQRTMDLNYFGVWRMTQAVLPAMRERGSGRIITVSSLGGLIGTPFNEVYAAAKFAVEGLIESAAPAARALGIHMSLIEPGMVNTEFSSSANPPPGESSIPADGPYAELFKTFRSAFGSATGTAQTGDDVAQTILTAATDAAPHLRYQTSEFSRAHAGRKLVDPTGDEYLNLMAGMMRTQTKA